MVLAHPDDAIAASQRRHERLIAVEHRIPLEPNRIDRETRHPLVVVVELVLAQQSADVEAAPILPGIAEHRLSDPGEIAMPIPQVPTLPIEPSRDLPRRLVEEKVAAPIVAMDHADRIHDRKV